MTITATDSSADYAALDGLVELQRSRVVAVSVDTLTDAAEVTEASAVLVQRLRSDVPKGLLADKRTIITLVLPDDADAVLRNALAYSLRGIVQSVTREFAHKSQAVNLLITSRGDLAALKPTFEYLDEIDGGYTAGFTFDNTATEAHA